MGNENLFLANFGAEGGVEIALHEVSLQETGRGDEETPNMLAHGRGWYEMLLWSN